jgi:hypothetical protein
MTRNLSGFILAAILGGLLMYAAIAARDSRAEITTAPCSKFCVDEGMVVMTPAAAEAIRARFQIQTDLINKLRIERDALRAHQGCI